MDTLIELLNKFVPARFKCQWTWNRGRGAPDINDKAIELYVAQVLCKVKRELMDAGTNGGAAKFEKTMKTASGSSSESSLDGLLEISETDMITVEDALEQLEDVLKDITEQITAIDSDDSHQCTANGNEDDKGCHLEDTPNKNPVNENSGRETVLASKKTESEGKETESSNPVTIQKTDEKMGHFSNEETESTAVFNACSATDICKETHSNNNIRTGLDSADDVKSGRSKSAEDSSDGTTKKASADVEDNSVVKSGNCKKESPCEATQSDMPSTAMLMKDKKPYFLRGVKSERSLKCVSTAERRRDITPKTVKSALDNGDRNINPRKPDVEPFLKADMRQMHKSTQCKKSAKHCSKFSKKSKETKPEVKASNKKALASGTKQSEGDTLHEETNKEQSYGESTEKNDSISVSEKGNEGDTNEKDRIDFSRGPEREVTSQSVESEKEAMNVRHYSDRNGVIPVKEANTNVENNSEEDSGPGANLDIVPTEKSQLGETDTGKNEKTLNNTAQISYTGSPKYQNVQNLNRNLENGNSRTSAQEFSKGIQSSEKLSPDPLPRPESETINLKPDDEEMNEGIFKKGDVRLRKSKSESSLAIHMGSAQETIGLNPLKVSLNIAQIDSGNPADSPVCCDRGTQIENVHQTKEEQVSKDISNDQETVDKSVNTVSGELSGILSKNQEIMKLDSSQNSLAVVRLERYTDGTGIAYYPISNAHIRAEPSQLPYLPVKTERFSSENLHLKYAFEKGHLCNFQILSSRNKKIKQHDLRTAISQLSYLQQQREIVKHRPEFQRRTMLQWQESVRSDLCSELNRDKIVFNVDLKTFEELFLDVRKKWRVSGITNFRDSCMLIRDERFLPIKLSLLGRAVSHCHQQLKLDSQNDQWPVTARGVLLAQGKKDASLKKVKEEEEIISISSDMDQNKNDVLSSPEGKQLPVQPQRNALIKEFQENSEKFHESVEIKPEAHAQQDINGANAGKNEEFRRATVEIKPRAANESEACKDSEIVESREATHVHCLPCTIRVNPSLNYRANLGGVAISPLNHRQLAIVQKHQNGFKQGRWKWQYFSKKMMDKVLFGDNREIDFQILFDASGALDCITTIYKPRPRKSICEPRLQIKQIKGDVLPPPAPSKWLSRAETNKQETTSDHTSSNSRSLANGADHPSLLSCLFDRDASEDYQKDFLVETAPMECHETSACEYAAAHQSLSECSSTESNRVLLKPKKRRISKLKDKVLCRSSSEEDEREGLVWQNGEKITEGVPKQGL